MRLHPRRRAARAPTRVLPVPDTALSVAVFVGEVEETGADLVQLYPREDGKVRGRDGVLLRDGEQVATVADLPWQERNPDHLARARDVEGRLDARRRARPGERRATRSRATRPWAVDASSSLEASRASRTTRRCARSSGRRG